MVRFDFSFDARSRFGLRLFGVEPTRARVEIDEGEVRVQFGPWSLVTGVDNISGSSITGPYQWWKVLGVRVSFADRGVTFGTNSHRGACLQLHQPVPVRLFNKALPLRHPGVTVTVREATALIEALPTPGSAQTDDENTR